MTPPQHPSQAAAPTTPTAGSDAAALAFIAKWQAVSGSELTNSQPFIIDLCDLLGVPRPHATEAQDYLFERPMKETLPDGSSLPRRVDCYRRGAFVWESKKLEQSEAARRAGRSTRGFDEKIERAYHQALAYARNLPASEGRPPFLVVADIGHFIELYAEFTRSGATYTAFPDPRSHRILMADLARPEIRQRLRALWTDPLSLDPARVSARVTREVSRELAELAKSLEAAGHAPQPVAAFLTRALFSMFAEDIGLLPPDDEGQGGFVALLTRLRTKPDTLQRMLQVLWRGMDLGGANGALEGRDTLRFNGKLFKGWNEDGYVLPLAPEQVDGLLRAARANWREVEPAIFGTLLERALNPQERHALGAHYTPRAYVERLVLPTVVEPLRADWADAQAAALLLLREADDWQQAAEAGAKTETAKKRRELEKKAAERRSEARAEIKRFHHQLCSTRVLDPACGSGNFLYVTLEHLKRLEGEVLNRLESMGEAQDKLGLEGETVTVAQLLGIELNPRAAALAELVLWIGWLQWQVRTSGLRSVAEPVVHDYRNIDCRDAVLAFDRQELATDPATGQPLTRWDGKTLKPHPVTGEAVPDEAAQVPQWRYVNPRPADWPQAEFIVGNPPYLGARTIRQALGDGYLLALRSVSPAVPDNADFVMYWWDKAAEQVAAGATRRFGLITTNSLRQSFNQVVLNRRLGDQASLTFAIPDHPWVDAANGAAVRVAMTVGSAGLCTGTLAEVTSETTVEDGEVQIELKRSSGIISSGLRLGAEPSQAAVLAANAGLSCVGYQLTGKGFVVEADEAQKLDPTFGQATARIRPLISGRDLTQIGRSSFAIDLFGLTEAELRSQHPAVYQWVLNRVKPERDQNARAALAQRWWIFGEARSTFRPALKDCPLVCATSLTAKHRTFVRVPRWAICDSTTVMFALGDAAAYGVMSCQVHIEWALAAGGRLGVGNDPRYNKSRCFETFPFPAEDTGLTPALAERIGALAEQIDAHRKRQQAAHEAVTLTGLYNVLEALRAGRALSAKEKTLHEQGLVSVLRSLHDELDAAVLQAYGWADLAPVPWPTDTDTGDDDTDTDTDGDDSAQATRHQTWTDTLLERLVALNTRRAAEEAAGTIRWLRPEFQDPARRAAAQAAAAESAASATAAASTQPAALAEGSTRNAPASAAPAFNPQQTPLPGMPETEVLDDSTDAAASSGSSDTPTPTGPQAALPRQPWPAALPQQTRALADALAASPSPLSLDALAERFTGRGPWKKSLPALLAVLESLGRARRVPGPGEEVWSAAG